MVQAAAAIGDFMLILMGSALRVGAGIAGAGLIGMSAVGGVAFVARRRRRMR